MSGRLAVARVRAGQLSQLQKHDVLVVPLPPSREGNPREALVVLDATGRARAYRNLCRHLPVPLHVLGRSAARHFPHDGELTCMTHGARYRLQDGLCIAGPCRGSTLHALDLEISDDEVFVLDDAAD